MAESVSAIASYPIELATIVKHRERARRGDRSDLGVGECVLDARLSATSSATRRILKALEDGTDEFVLSSVDGRTMARVHVAVSQVSTTEHALGSARIVVDWTRGSVSNGDRRIMLSRTELRLFAALLDARGRTVTRGELIARVWPGERLGAAERENALGVYVCSLRKRLTAIGAGDTLCTVRRVGYRVVI